jgi:quinol-cytochrome oxidoreductase complex cytochrome b subunit
LANVFPFFDGGKKIEETLWLVILYVAHCVLLSMVVQQPGAADRQTDGKKRKKINLYVFTSVPQSARGAVFLIFFFYFLFFIIGLS